MRKKYLASLFAWIAVCVPALAAVVSSVAVPSTRTDGTLITASIWNSDVLGIYSYINNNIVAALNVLTSKGDIYVYSGTNLTRLPVGADNQILIANSAQPTGLQWSAFANSTPLTTKGDILGYSSTPTRLGVGSNGQVLVADSTQALGIKWGSPATTTPRGTTMAWSPAFAGTSTIPSGWQLCDGTSGAPNLIGKFIIGTRPSGSSATAAAGGFGVQTADANGAGTATHTHPISASFSTGYPVGSTAVNRNPQNGQEVSGYTHVHSIDYSGNTTASSLEPSDYALVYIIKQ